MKLLSNKQLLLSIKVLLVCGTAVFILSPKTDYQETLVGHQLDKIFNNLNSIYSINQCSDQNYSNVYLSNFPSFKNSNGMHSDANSTGEVDFTVNKYSTGEFQTQKSKVNYQAAENNTSTNTSYYFRQSQNASNKTSNILSVSSQEKTFQTSNNTYPVDKGIQPMNTYEAVNSSNNKNSSNSFLANNSLSITADLTDNTTAMFIDGDTNPGDPGIPVGDGFWIMILFLGIYFLRLRF